MILLNKFLIGIAMSCVNLLCSYGDNLFCVNFVVSLLMLFLAIVAFVI